MTKSDRVLALFYRLLMGQRVKKAVYAAEAGIAGRSAERDIQTLRDVLAEEGHGYTLLLGEDGCYYLDNARREFTEMEVLLISKVLLSSRVLCDSEMKQIIRSMMARFPFTVRQEIKTAIQSEADQYVEPVHKKELLQLHWDLNRAMQKQLKIALTYRKASGVQVMHKVLPISIVASECYLYLVGFFEEKAYDYPAFFRLDRIVSAAVTDEHYNPRLFADYNMGKMKQCIQFMYAGKLMKVKLACQPRALEAVRDRLPNHRILGEKDGRTILTAKVFGEGFWRWALPYGDAVEVLEPEELRQKLRDVAARVTALYRSSKL